MKKYIRIYKTLFKINISALTAYIFNFYMNIFSSLLWASFTIVTIVLLTSQSSTVFGWTRPELITLTASFNILRGIFTTLFSKNFYRLSETIFKGNLDGLLLRPINSQFLVSVRYIDFTAFTRILVGVIIITYLHYIGDISVSFLNILGYSVLVGFGVVLLYSIWFIVITLLIWNPLLSNLKDFLIYITGITRYPPKLFRGLGDIPFMILLPILLVVTPGTRVLIGNALSGEIIGLVAFSLVLLFVSNRFWTYALKHYTSASS